MENCQHSQQKITSKPIANGNTQFVMQCQLCGERIGNAIGKGTAYQMNGGIEPPLFDFDRQRSSREAERQAHKNQLAKEREEFFGWYSIYLKSDKWREKRQKVLHRAQGICEGCRDADSTEVHHLTYDNVGDEFLFQLVALCHKCHTRLHKEQKVKRNGG